MRCRNLFWDGFGYPPSHLAVYSSSRLRQSSCSFFSHLHQHFHHQRLLITNFLCQFHLLSYASTYLLAQLIDFTVQLQTAHLRRICETKSTTLPTISHNISSSASFEHHHPRTSAFTSNHHIGTRPRKFCRDTTNSLM